MESNTSDHAEVENRRKTQVGQQALVIGRYE